MFATYLNVSPNAVRGWEQEIRRPFTLPALSLEGSFEGQQAALKLVTIAKRNPKALLIA